MGSPQHSSGITERRVMSRIDTALRVNYQVISDAVALNDPYDTSFVLPRYFLLLAELDQIDHTFNYELEQLNQKDEKSARILSLFNQKLNLITGSLYDSIVQFILPSTEQVNISETGLSFFVSEYLKPETYIHITLSHPDNFFHIAVTAQVAYSYAEGNDKFRTGVYFISLHPHDRVKLAECIAEQLQNNDLV